MISKTTILRQLTTTANLIAQKFDEIYSSDLEVFAKELATSYGILHQVINDEENRLSDNDFQSALLYWTALNSILSAIDLLRRGYTKEPQMIMRNALEVFAVAYDFHENQDRYKNFIVNPKKFEATRSIAEIKKVHKVIGQWYGMLSNFFTHVSPLHILPHKPANGLCIGGIFNPDDQTVVNINLMAIIGTLDVLNSVLELTFLSYISSPRFWKKIDSVKYQYNPDRKRVKQVMDRIRQSLGSFEI